MKIIYFNISLAIIAKLIVFILALLGMGQMWMAVIADVGVSILSVLNAARLLSVPKDLSLLHIYIFFGNTFIQQILLHCTHFVVFFGAVITAYYNFRSQSFFIHFQALV